MVGEGSECFGYDDDISRDHDWGAGFSIWLTDQDYQEIGPSLQEQYDQLPCDFLGFPKKVPGEMAGGRIGVLRQSDFYRRFTGHPEGPQTLMDWLQIPEHFLATATNGQIFHDPLGEFTRIRDQLLAFYPEDIRLKLIAKRCATIAQSGQYNVPRAIQRGELVAAQLALSEFIQATCSVVYLLNRRYTPFSKWVHHGLKELPVLNATHPLLDQLARQTILVEHPVVDQIEQICQLLIAELKRQNLSDSDDDFLGSHWPRILARIENPEIKTMHVFAGGF